MNRFSNCGALCLLRSSGKILIRIGYKNFLDFHTAQQYIESMEFQRKYFRILIVIETMGENILTAISKRFLRDKVEC